MAGDDNIREELVRFTQLLVAEGTKIVGAFAVLHRLHPTDVDALTRVMVAQDRGTPMTAGVLAEELGLTSGAITAVVDRLERAGHINRVRDQIDRRRVFLHYSPAGRVLAEEFFVPLLQHSGAVMDQFTPEELKIVRRYLDVAGADMATHRHSLDQGVGGPAKAKNDPTARPGT